MTASTKSDRAWRTRHLIRPIKLFVRQPDGSYRAQWVEASVKQDKRSSRKRFNHKRKGKRA